MILIADSGSTNTSWRLIGPSMKPAAYVTSGINPLHLSEEAIDKELASLSVSQGQEIDTVYFYGAGIVSEQTASVIEKALARRFNRLRDIRIGDDLLAAARALFQADEGIACILGTGSNSGYYSRGEVTDKIPPLGYILGDEGSGTDISRRVLNALFKRTLPGDLTREILKNEEMSMQEVLNGIYRSHSPARSLASYSRLAKKYIKAPEIRELVKDAFRGFIRKNISKYQDYAEKNTGFSGSIAVHFEEVLREVLDERQIRCVKIISSPVDGLVEYHMKQWQ